jgi:hypothetical protein
MQEQIAAMGDELMRLQSAQAQRAQAEPEPLPPAQALITDEDKKTYGQDLIDLVKRAAIEAVSPNLQALDNRNKRVVQAVTAAQRQAVFDRLDAEIPNWREINTSPRFKAWASLPDLYSGQLRGALLRAALGAANAPRVLAIFRGFLAEEQATGQLPAPQPAPQSQSAPAHAPAVPLETLVAPGRAHPAPGQTAQGAEKPIFTRAQISEFYRNKTRGMYAGREAEANQLEQAIFLAQREGRVR